MHLINELEFRQLAFQRLGPELAIASELIQMANGIYQREGQLEYSAGADDILMHLSAGLIAKVTKQYRAIVELCLMGLGEVADNNCRILFEASLAGDFLLNHRVKLMAGNYDLKNLGKPLTTKFRTMLYLANDAFTNLRNAEHVTATKGFKRAIRKSDYSGLKAKYDWFERKIGPEWTKRLNKSRNYSGLQIGELAKAFGQAEMYAIFYKPSCSGVHGANARDFVHVEDDEKIAISIGVDETSVMVSLHYSSIMLARMLSLMNMRFGFNLGESLSGLIDRIVTMRTEFPV